jgi:hypothetical protein
MHNFAMRLSVRLPLFLLVMISKYCTKIINVWNFSDPIVEVIHSEFSGPSLPSTKGTLRAIFCTLADKKSQDKKSQLIFLYVGRTESHNMYTLIHVCIILLCIVLKTDRDIVSGSFCCFKLSLSYQLAL